MSRLVIVGASGHGKVVADIASLCGYTDIVFVDDDESISECAGYSVIGKSHDAPEGEVFVAIGNSDIRERLMEYYNTRIQPVLIHPSAVIASNVEIQKGTVIMGGVVINPDTIIGRGCIVNTSSSIDHECIVGDYSHISVGSHLSGSVVVGKKVWIGAGATLINNINICDECFVGAGAVVVNNLEKKGKYIGVPARLMHRVKSLGG